MTPESAVTPESLAALFAEHNIRPIRQEHLCDWGTAYAAGADVLGILCIEKAGGDLFRAALIVCKAQDEALRLDSFFRPCLAERLGLAQRYLCGLDYGWMKGDVPVTLPTDLELQGARVGAEAARRLMPAPGVVWAGREV